MIGARDQHAIVDGALRVVLADDHQLLRDCLRTLFQVTGAATLVGECEDLRALVPLVEQHRPDVVVCDLKMPGGSALDIIRTLRPRFPETRFLVLTMYQEREFLSAALAAGASGYVLKQSASVELVAAIKAVGAGSIYVDHGLREEPVATDPSAPLSERERQVLSMLALGMKYREIADRLHVGERTVETYRRRIGDKLGLRSRAELVRYALELGLIASGELDVA